MKCPLCRKNNFRLIIKTKWPIKKCLYCGLVQVNPLPSRKEINSLYQGDYYKNFQPYFSQLNNHRKYFKKQIKEIKKYFKTGKILDVGCALGPFLEVGRREGFQAEGVEISDYAVAYCRKKNLTAYTGTIFSIKKPNYYDIITAFELIEHEREPLKMLSAAYKLLKKNGLLVITTPNYDSFWRKIFGRFWIGYRHREHLFFFSPKTLTIILKKVGFRNIIIKKDIPRPYSFDYFFRRLADYIPIIFLKRILFFMGELVKRINFSPPLNPWENMIVYAYK
ncbi:MAG: class I SAM-dependent methyltransferase [Microgenomates group bacterium]|nr:class I SAM-dependent methyltransferase [Microgenomates group bacterium]